MANKIVMDAAIVSVILASLIHSALSVSCQLPDVMGARGWSRGIAKYICWAREQEERNDITLGNFKIPQFHCEVGDIIKQCRPFCRNQKHGLNLDKFRADYACINALMEKSNYKKGNCNLGDFEDWCNMEPVNQSRNPRKSYPKLPQPINERPRF